MSDANLYENDDGCYKCDLVSNEAFSDNEVEVEKECWKVLESFPDLLKEPDYRTLP